MGNSRKADIAQAGKQGGKESRSRAKARTMNELYEELETPEGERKISLVLSCVLCWPTLQWSQTDSEGQGFQQEQSDKGRKKHSFKAPG